MARMVTGRNGSDTVDRAPDGARTSSMNCCLLVYNFDAAECPSIRQAISGANTSVMGPAPWRQASKAWRTTPRLLSVRVTVVSAIMVRHLGMDRPNQLAGQLVNGRWPGR